MSDSYPSIKASLDSKVKNNPITLIRGVVGNNFWTKCLQFAKDRILGKEVQDITTIADLQIIYWDATSGTFKFVDMPTGGTGTNDHDELLHNGGVGSHAILGGYLTCGDDVTVQSNSIEILGLERSFGVLKNGTEQCNGIHCYLDDWKRGSFLKLEFKDDITLGHGIGVQDGISFAFQSGANYDAKIGDIIYFWYDGMFLREINGVSLFALQNTTNASLQNNIQNNIDLIEGVDYRVLDIENKGIYKKYDGTIEVDSSILQFPVGYDDFDIEFAGVNDISYLSIAPTTGDNFTAGKTLRLRFLYSGAIIKHNVTAIGDSYGIRLKKGSDYITAINDILEIILDEDGYWYETNNLTTFDLKVNIADIIDDLNHADTDKPLSANQGKVLNSRFLKGSDIASATTITIPTDGEFCEITGTTEIDLIETAGYEVGKTISLKFTDACILGYEKAASDTAYGIHLIKGASYTTVAGDILMLKFDGAFWQEVNNLTNDVWEIDGNNISYTKGNVLTSKYVIIGSDVVGAFDYPGFIIVNQSNSWKVQEEPTGNIVFTDDSTNNQVFVLKKGALNYGFVVETDAINFYDGLLTINYTSQNIGIDNTAPTARLHLPAGTATAGTAPLKLTPGVPNTIPELGAVEMSLDGQHIYITLNDE